MNTDFARRVAMGLTTLGRLDAGRFLNEFAITGFRGLQRFGLSTVLAVVEKMLLAFALARQSNHPTTGAESFIINPCDPLVFGCRHMEPVSK